VLLGDEAGSSPHDARHLGAFSLAYAVGLLVVAARPARARSMLPVALVLGGAVLVSGVIDSLDSTVGALGEVTHLPEVLSVVLVWLLARPAPAAPLQWAAGAPPRAVSDDDRRDAM
jgi:hypothetical protein